MRKLLSLLALSAIAALGMAPSAQAAPLQSASLRLTLGTLPPANFPANATVAGTAFGPLTATLAAGKAFAGVAFTTIPLTAAPPISAIQFIIKNNAAGSFVGATPNKVGGPMVITGRANVRGFGGLTLLGVPLSLGINNTLKTGAFGIFITAIGAPWRAGVASVTGITTTLPNGTIIKTTVKATGSNSLTAGGAGTLTLVAPIKVITNIAGNLPTFGILTLTFIPEPGTLLLLGSGIAGLAILGRRRARS